MGTNSPKHISVMLIMQFLTGVSTSSSFVVNFYISIENTHSLAVLTNTAISTRYVVHCSRTLT